MRRFAIVLVALAALSVGLPTVASAAGSVQWNGQRGASSVEDCGVSEEGYLHWVLTPGGRSKLSTEGTTLNIDGTVYDAYRTGEGKGAIHFFTAYHDPATIGSAIASFSGTAGNRALLTISNGCDPGSVSPPQPCSQTTGSGGEGFTSTVHELGVNGPTSFVFEWEALNQPDQFEVLYEGVEIFDTGLVGDNINEGTGSATVNVPAGTSTQVTVNVTGTEFGTLWSYVVNCPV